MKFERKTLGMVVLVTFIQAVMPDQTQAKDDQDRRMRCFESDPIYPVSFLEELKAEITKRSLQKAKNNLDNTTTGSAGDEALHACSEVTDYNSRAFQVSRGSESSEYAEITKIVVLKKNGAIAKIKAKEPEELNVGPKIEKMCRQNAILQNPGLPSTGLPEILLQGDESHQTPQFTEETEAIYAKIKKKTKGPKQVDEILKSALLPDNTIQTVSEDVIPSKQINTESCEQIQDQHCLNTLVGTATNMEVELTQKDLNITKAQHEDAAYKRIFLGKNAIKKHCEDYFQLKPINFEDVNASMNFEKKLLKFKKGENAIFTKPVESNILRTFKKTDLSEKNNKFFEFLNFDDFLLNFSKEKFLNQLNSCKVNNFFRADEILFANISKLPVCIFFEGCQQSKIPAIIEDRKEKNKKTYQKLKETQDFLNNCAKFVYLSEKNEIKSELKNKYEAWETLVSLLEKCCDSNEFKEVANKNSNLFAKNRSASVQTPRASSFRYPTAISMPGLRASNSLRESKPASRHRSDTGPFQQIIAADQQKFSTSSLKIWTKFLKLIFNVANKLAPLENSSKRSADNSFSSLCEIFLDDCTYFSKVFNHLNTRLATNRFHDKKAEFDLKNGHAMKSVDLDLSISLEQRLFKFMVQYAFTLSKLSFAFNLKENASVEEMKAMLKKREFLIVLVQPLVSLFNFSYNLENMFLKKDFKIYKLSAPTEFKFLNSTDINEIKIFLSKNFWNSDEIKNNIAEKLDSEVVTKTTVEAFDEAKNSILKKLGIEVVTKTAVEAFDEIRDSLLKAYQLPFSFITTELTDKKQQEKDEDLCFTESCKWELLGASDFKTVLREKVQDLKRKSKGFGWDELRKAFKRQLHD